MVAVLKEQIMANAKTGLRLLSFSIFVTITWVIVGSIIQMVQNGTSGTSTIDITLISACVSVGCYIIELIGLHIAGKDNKYFRFASFLKISSLVLAIVCVILSAISKNMIDSAKATIVTINNVVNIVISVADVVALLSIVKGCKEISPRVKGQANVVLTCFILMAISTIVLSFININNNAGLAILALLLIILMLIASVVYAICYIILIFRTTANVGKSRNH